MYLPRPTHWVTVALTGVAIAVAGPGPIAHADTTYQVVKGPQGKASVATCPDGAKATSGGWEAGNGQAPDTLEYSRPTADDSGWEVASHSSRQVVAYAVCASETPPPPPQ